jgi:hypothetical protein
MEKRDFYVYVFLDQRKPSDLNYKEHNFAYQPFYVGVGCGGRIKVHFQPKNLTGYDIKTNIVNSIRKELGELPIHYRVYEGLTQEEAFAIEIDFIRTFGRIKFGTGILANISEGGEGHLGLVHSEAFLDTLRRKVYQYTLEGEFVREWRSLKDVTEHYRHLPNESGDPHGFGHIKKASREGKGTAIGYQWRSHFVEKLEPLAIKNVQKVVKSAYKWELLDPSTGEILHTFNNDRKTFAENHQELEKFLGRKLSAGNLSAGASHGLKMYGYKWRRVCKRTGEDFRIVHSPRRAKNRANLD